MIKVIDELYKLQDKKYMKFQSKLIPTLASDKFIGVRVPELRNLAKEIINSDCANEFIFKLPHKYYDENMLHGLLLSEIKDYDECVREIDRFLPYVDNWAVCDTMSPKIFKKYKNELLFKIMEWINSDKIYVCRFGIGILMKYFLDDDFKKEYLEIVSSINSNEYYVNMMISWFFATALAKQWDDAIIYILNNKLDKWVHNKTIQKALESFRISNDKKEYLKLLKL